MLPHVATQVAQLVASVKGLGHKLPNLLLNLCPSAACAATSCVHQRPRLYLDVTWNPMATAYHSENGIPNDVIFSSDVIAAVTSLGIPFSDWLNETVSKCVRTCCSMMCPV